MPTARYLHYDVFTSRPFEGNQLAVFHDGRGLDTRQMQTLTNEMNFAESTFVLPAEAADTDVRMRIFTPAREMPMAGHPTIGTTFALASLGVIPRGRARWVFGLNVGPTAVALEWGDDGLTAAWMDQGRPEFRQTGAPGGDVVAAINGDPAAWAATGLPVEEASCGAPFFYVPLSTRAAVDACHPDSAKMRRLQSAFPEGHVGVFVFTAEPGPDGATVYSRMFAPEAGVVEDPATGGASGPLGGYLVRHGIVPVAAGQSIVSAQGVKMGRPSRLHVRVEATSPADITRAHVGGCAVRVGDGVIEW
ncbi:MAG: PhzF family phenazine biosynthesis protein [Acidobacteria bacterium]|nr:PhzF family phenazine biosynthesis protein [Acidobacteriota bacterium]